MEGDENRGLGCKVRVVKSKGEILEVERGSLLSSLTLSSSFYLTVSLYKEPRDGRTKKKSVSLFRLKTVKI